MRILSNTALSAAAVVLAALFTMGAGVGLLHAQPVLSDLWPNSDGTKWTYEFAGWDLGFEGSLATTWDGQASLTLAGTTTTAGGTAQNLVAVHDGAVTKPGPRLDPLYRNLWRARPDLRPAISQRLAKRSDTVDSQVDWVPLLLNGGFFMKLSDKIEMWQQDWDHATWTYLTDALAVGQMFTHQLIPELADDVFLHGTVQSVDAVIITPAGTFTNAVKIRYEIDYGVSDLLDPSGTSVLGTFQASTVGHVYYVPAVGPVDMLEEFTHYVSVDCSPLQCPQQILDQVGEVALHLTLQLGSGPVAVEERPWSFVKELYQE